MTWLPWNATTSMPLLLFSRPSGIVLMRPDYYTIPPLDEIDSLESAGKWVAVEGRKLAYTVHFTSYKAGSRSRRILHDRKWRHVASGNRKWPGRGHLTRSHLEVAVEGWKLVCTVHFTSYKAVNCSRRQSREGKWVAWLLVTGSDPEVVIWPEVTWKCV